MTGQTTAAPGNTTGTVAASILRELLTIHPGDQALDDLVHTTAENCEGQNDLGGDDALDDANAKAASVNNDGFAAQISYLLKNGVSEPDIIQALKSSKIDG
ncbi:MULTISPECIES: hypothetical protein [Pseudomonas]|uniref:Uncharacterized protein n=1 Tax=Pseudomonas fluorescens TaxID=294 RepID=A0A166QMF7_PSEFL|nr:MULTISPECIES: hypothetical protein [Pseudomonas]KZN20523.1 hypothetical protein A1D17_02990 [Pseudomonas fluorescens]